eukprot:6213802-Pleurochrysis_carterae.AAC.3
MQLLGKGGSQQQVTAVRCPPSSSRLPFTHTTHPGTCTLWMTASYSARRETHTAQWLAKHALRTPTKVDGRLAACREEGRKLVALVAEGGAIAEVRRQRERARILEPRLVHVSAAFVRHVLADHVWEEGKAVGPARHVQDVGRVREDRLSWLAREGWKH